MYSILVVFERPKPTDLASVEKWKALSESLQGAANTNKDFQMLGENCLLLSIDRGLDVFYEVVRRTQDFPYRYAILRNEEMQWYVKKEGCWMRS